jgi:hypothetical protein
MNTANWKSFRFDEIFDIKKGKRLTKADMVEGDINFIGATDSNNGITAKISNDKYIHSANTITVSYNGSIAEAFYQSKPFWATDDVNVLYPKFSLTQNIALFLCTIIHKEKYRFNYGRKWDKEMMQQSKIKLPINSDNNPDWQWIENYVKNTLVPKLPQKAKSVWNKNFDKDEILDKKVSLNNEKWKWVELKNLFKMERGVRLTKGNRKKENIPLITAGLENKGVAEYISNEEMKRYNNAITIDMFGNCFYRNYTFCCDDNILVLSNENLNHYSGLFLSAVIDFDNYKFAYGRQYRQKNFNQHKIKIPITTDNTPDWQFMENYIKSLPYSKSI